MRAAILPDVGHSRIARFGRQWIWDPTIPLDQHVEAQQKRQAIRRRSFAADPRTSPLAFLCFAGKGRASPSPILAMRGPISLELNPNVRRLHPCHLTWPLPPCLVASSRRCCSSFRRRKRWVELPPSCRRVALRRADRGLTIAPVAHASNLDSIPLAAEHHDFAPAARKRRPAGAGPTPRKDAQRRDQVASGPGVLATRH